MLSDDVFFGIGIYLGSKNEQKNIGIALIFGLSLTMTGCAPLISGIMNLSNNNDTVESKTAKYFGVDSKELKITDIDKGVLSTTYQTRYKGNVYNCRIYYGDVECLQPGAGRSLY